MQTFITNNGNILNVTPSSVFFTKPSGEFLRLVGTEEKEYLLNDAKLPKVEIEGYEAPKELPIWQYMWSANVDDYTDYKEATCNNGGDYSYHTESMFFARQNGRKLEWCKIDFERTSADFDYTHDGHFVSSYEQAELNIIGTDQEDLVFRTQASQDEEISLDQISEKVSGQYALSASDIHIPSKYDDAEEETKELSEIEIKERKEKIAQYFGSVEIERPRRKGNRRG